MTESWKHWRRPALGRARGGNIAVLLALLLPLLALAAAAAVDLSTWLRGRTLVKSAIDAGILRGARELQVHPADRDAAVLAATRLYQEQTVRLQLRNDTLVFEVVDGGAGLTAHGSVAIDTRFLRLLGVATLPLLSLTGGDAAKGIVTIGLNARRNLEIALAVDVAAATADSLAALKSSLESFVVAVVWPPGGQFRSRAALVPFADGVMPGALMPAVAAPAAANGYFDLAEGGRARLLPADCVGERQGASAFTDASPDGADVLPRSYTASGRCMLRNAVLPLTQDLGVLETAIGSLNANAATASAGHVGAAWAWYLVSPQWASLVGSAAAPQADSDLAIPQGTAGSLMKVVVLIGSGPFAVQFCNSSAPVLAGVAVGDRNTPAGSGTAAGACVSANGGSEQQLGLVCANMRAAGIRVFSVSVAAAGSANPGEALRACASAADDFYEASAGNGVELAMRSIAMKITSSYLSQ